MTIASLYERHDRRVNNKNHCRRVIHGWTMPSMAALVELLGTRLDDRGAIGRLAAQVGMSYSGFLRGLKASTLAVDNLVKLADVVGVNPSEMLRAGGKGEYADLVERMYGAPVTPAPPDEAELLKLYRQAPAAIRDAARVVLRAGANSSAAQIPPLPATEERAAG